MKILIIHYRFFVSGGPERYLFNLKEILEKKGHQVIPFSIRYTKNVESEYNKYFVTPLSKENEVYFRDQTWNLKTFLKTLERSFYSQEVYESLKKLINDTRPDSAIVLQFARKLSPSALTALYHKKIPFVVRISDFGMICANAHFLRQQKICELCIHGDLFYSVRYKCVQNSFGASLVNFFVKKFHHYMGYYNNVKYYMVPSKFTLNKMIEAGFSAEKLIHIPTFINTNEIKSCAKNKKRQIIYLGRIDQTKGVHVLLEAIKILHEESFRDFNCVIAGFGPNEYKKQLRNYLEEQNIKNVYFTGQLKKTILYGLIQESLFSVAPSLWYENMPNSVLESLAIGTPTIASNHGSFPEIIKNGETGLLFNPGDAKDLSNKIKFLLDNKKLLIKMSINAKEYINENHSPQKHYDNIMNLFDKLINEKNL